MGGHLHASKHVHPPSRHRHHSRAGLWEHGILDWHAFLMAAQCDRLPKSSYRSAVPLVQQSLDAVSHGDANSSTAACRAEKRGDSTEVRPTGHYFWISRPPACHRTTTK